MQGAKNLLLASYESLQNRKSLCFFPNINRVAKSKERPQSLRKKSVCCTGQPGSIGLSRAEGFERALLILIRLMTCDLIDQARSTDQSGQHAGISTSHPTAPR
jgi:hypothetical protein